MNEFNFISNLEGNLRACISLESHEKNAGYWIMRVQLFYQGEPAGVTSFNLQGYNQEEATDVAMNLNKNPFLMREIDEFLWGESE